MNFDNDKIDADNSISEATTFYPSSGRFYGYAEPYQAEAHNMLIKGFVGATNQRCTADQEDWINRFVLEYIE
jgi:hypothetical protein